MIPKAQGTAARLREEAEGYKARVVAQAEGDAQRFSRVLAEYQKAPGVTRDRLYIDTMQQVYSNVSKVMVDSRSNSNLLYLPLDKLMQQAGAAPRRQRPPAAAPAAAETTPCPRHAVDDAARATASAAATATAAEHREHNNMNRIGLIVGRRAAGADGWLPRRCSSSTSARWPWSTRWARSRK